MLLPSSLSCPAVCLCPISLTQRGLLFFVAVVVSSMGCVHLFYNLGHNLISHFLAQIVPPQATGCSFGVLLHQAGMSSSGSSVCVITSFLSGTVRRSRLFLYIPARFSRCKCSPKEFRFPVIMWYPQSGCKCQVCSRDWGTVTHHSSFLKRRGNTYGVLDG